MTLIFNYSGSHTEPVTSVRHLWDISRQAPCVNGPWPDPYICAVTLLGTLQKQTLLGGYSCSTYLAPKGRGHQQAWHPAQTCNSLSKGQKNLAAHLTRWQERRSWKSKGRSSCERVLHSPTRSSKEQTPEWQPAAGREVAHNMADTTKSSSNRGLTPCRHWAVSVCRDIQYSSNYLQLWGSDYVFTLLQVTALCCSGMAKFTKATSRSLGWGWAR